MLGLVKLMKCPYCPRGRGIIAADVDVIMRAAARGDKFAGGNDAFLVHDPDAPSGGPCPHVVSHVIDVNVIAYWRHDPGGTLAPDRLASATHSWDHTLFAGVEEYIWTDHLWCEVNGGDHVAFHPACPYRIKLLGRTRRLGSSRYGVQTGGTVILAIEPEVFVRELVDGAERLQDFYARSRR